MNILTTNPMVEATEEIAQAPVETLAEGVTEAADTLSISFWDLFMSGGWLMWVLVLLAAVMIFDIKVPDIS